MQQTPRYERTARSILRRCGTARSRDLVAAGVSRTQMTRMVRNGRLTRIARGLYTLPESAAAKPMLAAVAKRAPRVVFCLLTALRIHDLTTQAPHEVWIAIGNKQHPPRLAYPPLRTVRLSPESLRAGVERRKIDGVEIRVTTVAKTIVDCFKFRNKIGLDVALEALREARARRRVSFDELWRYARVDRVTNVMRPYLEAIS